MVCCFLRLLASSSNQSPHNPTVVSRNGRILRGKALQCRMCRQEVGKELALAPEQEVELGLELAKEEDSDHLQ